MTSNGTSNLIARKILFTLIFTQILLPIDIFAANFTVTKTSDTYPTGKSGELRWAIQQVNKSSGTSQILFKIPGTGPFTIKPVKDLDSITRPVTINGYSQPGATANTLATGNNAHLLIVLSGNNYKTGNAYQGSGNGLFFSQGSDGSIVKGLVISTWINTGIMIYNANNIRILGNFIGTNPTGSAQLANQAGIFIESGSNTTIGSSHSADRNIIAGSFFFFNESSCIVADNSQGTVIKGNYIGTNAAGTAKLGNSLSGITCSASNNTTIGGTTLAERNVISGHVIVGITIESSSNAQIMRNYIGTNVSGTKALGNSNEGIAISGSGIANSAINNRIINNIISGNNIGIKLGSLSSTGANKNTIQNNLIGTDYTGKIGLPNNYGIVINDNGNTIGGNTSSNHNIISANKIGGILVYGGAQNNVIQYNYIGLNAATKPLTNGYGIQLGLPGGKGAAANNAIANNSFGGGNKIINIYS